MIRKIPTSADIYLEVDGVKVAVVQSYRAVTTRKSRAVEALGPGEAVATGRGALRPGGPRAPGGRGQPVCAGAEPALRHGRRHPRRHRFRRPGRFLAGDQQAGPLDHLL